MAKLTICQDLPVYQKNGTICGKANGVNGVPREVPRPKPEGPQALSVLAAGLPRGTPFTTRHQGFFPYNVVLWSSRTRAVPGFV